MGQEAPRARARARAGAPTYVWVFVGGAESGGWTVFGTGGGDALRPFALFALFAMTKERERSDPGETFSSGAFEAFGGVGSDMPGQSAVPGGLLRG